jgi:hypothetical protein
MWHINWHQIRESARCGGDLPDRAAVDAGEQKISRVVRCAGH